MKTILTAVLLHFSCTWANAQFLNKPMMAAYCGIGAFSRQHTDAFSQISNPASLAQVKKPAAGMAASRRFLLADLSEYMAVAAITTSSGNFGLRLQYAGSVNYNVSQAGFAYGRKLGRKVDAGVLFAYNTVHISSGYGAASMFSAEAGATLHINDQLHTGIQLIQPAGKYGKDRSEESQPVITWGIGYEPSANFLCSASIEKTMTQPVNIVAGIQYNPVPVIQLRAGISTSTSSFWMGAGWELASVRIGVQAMYHPQLGISPGIVLLYQLKKESR